MRDDVEEGESRGPRRWLALARTRWQEIYDSSGLVRHLIHEPLFLVAVVGLTLCAGGVAILLPKWWNPAPPDFSRTIRVSLLDYVQAWNLRRAARNAGAAGRAEDALLAWRAAILNNLADPASHRGALEFLRDAPQVHSANIGLAFFCKDLLLELTATNRADSLLVAEVMLRHRIPEMALESLRAWKAGLSSEEEIVWIGALLAAGRTAEFEARWQAGRERFKTQALPQLYRAALDAMGPPAVAVDGLERLRAALPGPDHRLESARLLCLAALRRDDATDYERGLQVLRELDSTMVQDEAGWWGLLARHDRLDEATRLARAYDRVPPPTPFEAVQLVRIWSELGLTDLALAMLKDHADRYGVAFEVWGAYFDLLVQRRDWDEVRRVAASLRGNAGVRDEVLAITWYADAIADLTEDRRTSAREYLKRLRSATLPSAVVTLRLAAGLMQVREFETSAELLRRIEPELSAAPEYWLQVLSNALNRKDIAEMRRGTDQLLQVQPDNTVGLNMRLGLLLLSRESPGEALALSLRLLNGGLKSSSAWINHSVALLQNRRTAEARSVLEGVPADRLSAGERAAWMAARTEVLEQEGRYQEALAVGADVDLDQLLPPDAEWLRKLLADCRRRVKAGSQ